MADLKQMNKVLADSINNINAYARVFNNASTSVISETEAMGKSAVELKNQINSLVEQAKGLEALGKSINLDDKGQVDNYISKIKDLDKTISSLAPVIMANLREMNDAFQKEFKLDEHTPGYIKSQLNELVQVFSEVFSKTEVSKIAPDLSAWADKFVEQVDKIEYAMGRITEFGKHRNETEKALGFTVRESDVSSIRDEKLDEIEEYNKWARDYGFSDARDTKYLELFPDVMTELDSIDRYIKNLDSAVGRKIKGYVELFNEAENLLKSGESHQSLYEAIGSPFTRSLYGDNVDWKSMTPSRFKELDSQIDLGDSEFFTVNNTHESIDKAKESADKASTSIRNYNQQLNDLISTDKVLSSEQKQGILGTDFSEKIKKYNDDINYFKQTLSAFGNTTLAHAPETKLDVNDPEQFTSFTRYKDRVNEALDSLKILKDEQKDLFSRLNDPIKIKSIPGTGISNDLFGEVKQVLESGYKVNFLEGSADKAKLDELRKGFEQLVNDFKGHNIDIVPDKDIEDLLKVNALQSAINNTLKQQEETARVKATYERDRERYLNQYNKIAQAQANVKALTTTRNTLLVDKNKNEQKDINARYAREIFNQNKVIEEANDTIVKLKAQFNKYKLEIPVVPKINKNAKLEGQFRTDYLNIKGTDRQNILGNLNSKATEIDNLNNRAKELGLNVDKINSRLSAMSTTIKTAFYSGDIDRAKSLASVYSGEVDKLRNKVEGQAKAQDIANKRAIEAERNARLQAKAAEESARAVQREAEREKKAHEDALKAARDKVNGTLNAIKSFANGVNNAVNKVISIIRTGISIINKVISGATKILVTLGRGVTSIISLLGNLGNRIRSVFGSGTSDVNKFNGGINILKGTFTELNNKINFFKNTFNSIFNNEAVNKAKKLLSSIYSIGTIGGSGATDDVIKWATTLENAFGLSARDLISDMQELNGVMYGLGMTAENSVLASENLLMMGNYLASIGFAGGDVDQVISKLTSGMKGMTASIDDLGLSVRDAQMNEFLEDLKAQGGEFANLKTDFSSLSEQARVYVRYASLIQQFTDKFDITNFAKGLDTVTGRVTVFKSSVNKLMSVLGTGLLNVFAKLTTFLIPLINFITSLVTKLFSLFGISVDLSSTMNGGVGLDKVGDQASDTKDKLDEVSKSAEKAKGSIQGFDRVNNVTTSSGSGSDSGSGDDFDYSSLMTSMLDELNKLAEEATQSFADSMQEKMIESLKTAWDKFNEYAKEKTGRLDFDLGFDWAKIKENLTKTITNIRDFIVSWGDFFIVIGLKVADDLNIGGIITAFTGLIEKVTDVADRISIVLQPALDTFYEIGLKPIMEYIGVETLNIIDLFINKLEELATWFENNPDTVNKFFEDLGEKVAQAFRVLTGQQTLDDVVTINSDETGWGTFLRILDTLPEKIDNIVNRVSQLVSVLSGAPSLDAVAEMNRGSAWGSTLSILNDVKYIIDELLEDLGEFAENEGLPWLQEQLNKLATWLNENKEEITSLIKTLASTSWDLFKQFVELVGKLVDWAVKNPDKVANIFKGLLALKVGSWLISTVFGIKELIVTLTALKGLGGVFGFLGKGVVGLGTKIAGLFGSGGAIAGLGTKLSGLGTTIGTTLSGSIGTTLAGGASIALLVAGLNKATDSMFKDGGLGYSFKALFSGEFFDTKSSEEINKWADKYFALMEIESKNTGAEVKDLKEKYLSIYREVLVNSGQYTTEQVDLMIGQFENHLDSHVDGKLSTLADSWFGNKKEAEAWAQSVWDSSNNVKDSLSSASETGVTSLDTLLVGMENTANSANTAFGQLSEGVNTGKDNVVMSLDELIASVDGYGTEAQEKSSTIGNNIALGLITGLMAGSPTTLLSIGVFIKGIIDTVKNLLGIHSPSTVFKGIGSNIVAGLKNGMVDAWSSFKSTIINLCSNLVSSIKNALQPAFNKISELSNKAKNAVSNVASVITSGWNTLTGKTKAVSSGKVISTNASGGSIAGGQLFIANEHGESELIGKIDGTGKTNVANNSMIIEAMSNGVFTGVYNALAEVNNQRGTVGNSNTNTTIKIEGFGLIDSSTLPQLARLLAPYLNSNNSNIANINFSI